MCFYSTNNSIKSFKFMNLSVFISLHNKYAFQFLSFSHRNHTVSNSLTYKSNKNNYKLISRNFFIELINKFWQETIFVSRSDSLSDIYIEQLKSDKLSIYSNDYKNFLYSFSKALINDRIHIVSNDLDHKKVKLTNQRYTKYIWKKGFNFSWPTTNSYFLSLIQYPFISTSRNYLIDSLLINKLPVFTVINNFNQIVLSESSNEILANRNIVDSLYKIYSKYFLSNISSQIKYQALFFINPNDAQEYKQHIMYKNSVITNNNFVNLFVTRLDVYYSLMQMKMKHIDFRLIPDLEEVGLLLSKYRHYKNFKLHYNQYCLNESFQGQPIYFIEPVLAKNKHTGKLELIKYVYCNDNQTKHSKYTAVFMNYKTALLAWQKFKQEMFNYKLPNQPNVTVYNLENFIKTYDNNTNLVSKPIVFVPSIESYFYLKSHLELNNKNWITNQLLNKFSYLKMFSQRVMWSLTSRQPVNL